LYDIKNISLSDQNERTMTSKTQAKIISALLYIIIILSYALLIDRVQGYELWFMWASWIAGFFNSEFYGNNENN
jgi:hypothetical protein